MLDDYGRTLVADLPFFEMASLTGDVLRDAGFQIVSWVSVDEELKRTLDHDFRRYALIVACSPETMLHVLMKELAAGPFLPVTLAVYELADGETAVVAPTPFEALTNERGWRREYPGLAAVAAAETDRLGRAMDDLAHRAAARKDFHPAFRHAEEKRHA